MIINHNIPSMKAYQHLERNDKVASKAMERLSSGLRINSAADDSAGLAIAEKMTAQIRGLKQAQRNVMDGISLIQTTEGAMGEIQNILQRMNELSVQAANGALSDEDRSKIQGEIDELKVAIDSIAKDTQFNEINTLAPPTDKEDVLIGGVDISFVIDATGSMDVYAREVAQNLEKFIESVVGKGVTDIRVSIMCYNDKGIQEYDFTTNSWINVVDDTTGTVTGNEPQDRWATMGQFDGIKQGLNSLPTAGGTENVMETLQYASENLDYRDNLSGERTKHAIVLTDEIGDDLGKTQETIQMLNDKGITTHGVYNEIPTGTHPTDGIEKVFEATGGQAVDIKSSDWYTKLADEIGQVIGEGGAVEELEGYEEIILQVGANSGQHVNVKLYYMRTKELGIEELILATQEQAGVAIKSLQDAVSKVSERRAYLGSIQNRLESTYNIDTITEENLTASKSRIQDADMAMEMSEFTKNNILSQASNAMLAQANMRPQDILKLLQSI